MGEEANCGGGGGLGARIGGKSGKVSLLSSRPKDGDSRMKGGKRKGNFTPKKNTRTEKRGTGGSDEDPQIGRE